jgi:hypothetical protein
MKKDLDLVRSTRIIRKISSGDLVCSNTFCHYSVLYSILINILVYGKLETMSSCIHAAIMHGRRRVDFVDGWTLLS